MKILKNMIAIVIAIAGLFAVVLPMYTQGESAAMVALAQMGKPYVLNDLGPDTFDCSGLVLYAYATLGMDVLHFANGVANDDQYETFEKIEDARIGDLFFFDTIENNKRPVDHVGICIGDGRFVHASSTAGEVTIATWNDTWRERFTWGKRLVKPYDVDKVIEKIKSLQPKGNAA